MPTDVRPHDVPRQLIEVVRANGAEIGEGGNLLMAVLAVGGACSITCPMGSPKRGY